MNNFKKYSEGKLRQKIERLLIAKANVCRMNNTETNQNITS
jgi:hypothetical protein